MRTFNGGRCLFAAMSVALSSLAGLAGADVINVSTNGFAFSPARVDARPGDTIHFIFTSCCHSVDQAADGSTCTVMPGGFTSGACGGRPTYDFVIPANATGSIFYICKCHCAFGMKGEIRVTQPCEGAAVSQSPADVTACRGADATFSVTASGTAPLSYQWRINQADIPGANGATHTITGVTIQSAGEYDCVVTNACGNATSTAATLTVCGADQNCDGFLDFFDYDDYVSAFEAGAPSADYNGDGFLDFFDYDGFVGAFETGC